MSDEEDLCPYCQSDEPTEDRLFCEMCGTEICQACSNNGMCDECYDKDCAREMGDA